MYGVRHREPLSRTVADAGDEHLGAVGAAPRLADRSI